MLGRRRVEGYAIVSSDGMIADANGEMPPAIRNRADQKFLQSGLERAAVIVHGRHSHEGGLRAAKRKRLILTRRVAALAPDTEHSNSLLWNPAGCGIEPAIDELGAPEGAIAVIGGTEVFGMFLPYYDAFHLSCATRAILPSGRPLFPEVGRGVTIADVLAHHGLRPGPSRPLDAEAGVTVVTWER